MRVRVCVCVGSVASCSIALFLHMSICHTLPGCCGEKVYITRQQLQRMQLLSGSHLPDKKTPVKVEKSPRRGGSSKDPLCKSPPTVSRAMLYISPSICIALKNVPFSSSKLWEYSTVSVPNLSVRQSALFAQRSLCSFAVDLAMHVQQSFSTFRFPISRRQPTVCP